MDEQNKTSDARKIWLAGGCFWGVEAFFRHIPGIVHATAGYANGHTEHPRYEELSVTGHAETVEVQYDPEQVSLTALLCFFFRIIDPTAYHRQGGDVGNQYRSGIYYRDEVDLPVIQKTVAREQHKYKQRIVTEVEPLNGFYPAESYHQQYLEKNPGGYCHIDMSLIVPAHGEWKPENMQAPVKETLRQTLPAMSYTVTQENGTEPPFQNAYWDNEEPGIYVDILTGEPLFATTDQFASGCGWPSFTRPISGANLQEKTDTSHGMLRTEVKSGKGSVHLGHVFDDGPKEDGGLRYCINSAALRFVPCAEMIRLGYGAYLHVVR
ncbi:peptide-methionine (R)-S-oxide reductase MsrB [Ethanoligenens sp.]|uniref:peptide-methionine (R)-S-oxide reductase MsrB n=1 Tax=Ethanoligenens sp. TaxID=2099655 RepID=UPI0039E98DD7